MRRPPCDTYGELPAFYDRTGAALRSLARPEQLGRLVHHDGRTSHFEQV
ncbi:hypothetical protein Q5762_08615 [Streptomyces sp. P9(2023)]|nr:hypothetical protein [Streptomyces sp. P9(2023)]MDT9688418.1 hypothetical protein [Streptomyces sp. P9(2023)]